MLKVLYISKYPKICQIFLPEWLLNFPTIWDKTNIIYRADIECFYGILKLKSKADYLHSRQLIIHLTIHIALLYNLRIIYFGFENAAFSVASLCMSNMNNTADLFIKMCGYGGSTILFIITQFPSRNFVLNQTIYCVIIAVLMIPTVLLNSISVLTIWKSSYLKAKVCYFLILIQSIVDIAVGVITVPAYIAFAALELRDIGSCVHFVVLQTLAYIPATTSFMTICFISLERYLSILHPVLHRSYVTNNRMLTCVICAIVWSTVTGPALTIFSEKLHEALNAVVLLGVLAFNTFAYTRIYFAVKNLHVSNDGIGDYSTEQSSSNMEGKRKSLRERSLAKSCALVVFISYFCYVPFFVCYLYFKNDPINLRFAGSWSGVVLILNSSLNSVVFFWRRPLLREEALNVLRKIACI